MKHLALIPARMGSSRFPGKPMALINGKPMIGHVYERVNRCRLLAETAVATCDQEIADYIRSIGGTVVMTSDKHKRASDRCAEALVTLEGERGLTYDTVVMVQGDEPMVRPEMISEALTPLIEDPKVQVVNLLGKFGTVDEFESRNSIKVVCDLYGNALYFSREPIPTRVNTEDIPMGKQVCIIPFRRDFLLKYTALDPTPLEIAESIDMMRVLEHGFEVRMVPTEFESYPVDTEADLRVVETKMMAERSN